MARQNPTQNSFAGGEFSDEMNGRTDLAVYKTGMRQAVNGLCLPQGPFERRSGSKFSAEVKTSADEGRLRKFQFSNTQTYMLEMGDTYIRFYTNEARLESPPGTPIEVLSTPYLKSELFGIHFAQENDVMYLVHPDHQTYKLTRVTATSFSLTKVAFVGAKGPLLAPNVTSITLTPSATSGAIAVTASSALFDSTKDVGRVIRIKTGYAIITGVTSTTLVNATVGTTLVDALATTDWALGMYSDNQGALGVQFHEGRLGLFGAPDAPDRYALSDSDQFERFTQETSNDADAIVKRLVSEEVNNIQWATSADQKLFVGTEAGEFIVFPAQDAILTPSSTLSLPISNIGSIHVQPVIVEHSIIFAQKNGRKLRRIDISAISTDGTDNIRADDVTFLSSHMFPKDGQIKEMAVQKDPKPILWVARTDGVLAGYTVSTNPLVIAATRHFIGGTDTNGTDAKIESIGVVPNLENTEDNLWILAKREINSATKRYVEFLEDRFDPGHNVRKTEAELIKALEQGWFIDSGVEHDVPIVVSGVTQANPGIVTATGHGLLDDEEVRFEDIVGMLDTDGDPALNEKTFVVDNSLTNTFTLKDPDTGVAVDTTGFTAYVSGGEVRKKVTAVSGLTHLEGETVQVLADGAVHPDVVVSSGAISLTRSAAKVRVGLGFVTYGETMPFSLSGALGDTIGQTHRIVRAVLRFIKTLGGSVGTGSQPTGNDIEPIEFREGGNMNESPPLFTGDKEVPVPGGWTTDPTLYFEQNQPLPFTVAAVMPRMEAGER